MIEKRTVELTDAFIGCAYIRNKDAEDLVKKFMNKYVNDSRRALKNSDITIHGITMQCSRKNLTKAVIQNKR